jgi:stage V sporulation protein AA
MNAIYIVPKESFTVNTNSEVKFSDIAELYSKDMKLDQLMNTVVLKTEDKEGFVAKSPFELISICMDYYPNAQVELVKYDDILISVESIKKRSSFGGKIINSAIYMLLFFGSALSVMYFHIDVGMLETQKEFAAIFGSQTDLSVKILGIAYSIGIAVGMFFFFKNKKVDEQRIPSPIDIKMSSYKDNVVSFLKNKIKEQKGNHNVG